MKNWRYGIVLTLGLTSVLGANGWAQQNHDQPRGNSTPGGSLTIYNQDFAVIRTPLKLDLRAGTNEVSETNVTALLEPDSVVLRDLTGRKPIHIVEQNYEDGLRTQLQMLAKFEGQTIDFSLSGRVESSQIVRGKIVKAAAVPMANGSGAYAQYGYMQQEPLIEVDGKLAYGLPGLPIFPASSPGLILKPTLRWLIASERTAKLDAELDYISHGLSWDATYNVVAPVDNASGDERLALIGWVNVSNQSGTDFRDVSLQLMAGDVSKITNNRSLFLTNRMVASETVDVAAGAPQMSQKSFDEYHLYDLHRTATLLDRESKQIEFLNESNISAHRVYVYDGFRFDNPAAWLLIDENFGGGTHVNKKVRVEQEFENTEANHLGVPLPRGRIRFYRKDTDGSLQFVGENEIGHTPRNETVKVALGDSFDLTGDHVRTSFKRSVDHIVESYTVTVKNAKTSTANVHVVEHLYRSANWQISANTDSFTKKNSDTIEFPVEIPAGGQKQVSYTVTYDW